MGCYTYGDDKAQVVICAPDSYPWRGIQFCPTCERRRRFAGFDQAWYGVTLTCLACGDSWSDGEMLERPFRRGWRDRARAEARKWWDRAAGMRQGHLAWIKDQLRGSNDC
jgi:hypothetical protein